ncbi:hypothetical protein AAVH_42891, partial [Aphelenchoides avenae]
VVYTVVTGRFGTKHADAGTGKAILSTLFPYGHWLRIGGRWCCMVYLPRVDKVKP